MDNPRLLARCLPVLALLQAACGAVHDQPSLGHYGDEMTESVDVVRASLSAHSEQVLGATKLSAVIELERRHMDDMDLGMARMSGARNSMERCGDHMRTRAGYADALRPVDDARDAMGAAMQDMIDELDRHLGAMEAAADLEAALSEERQHRTHADLLLGRMRQHEGELFEGMQAMQDDGFSMMCPIGSHMHHWAF